MGGGTICPHSMSGLTLGIWVRRHSKGAGSGTAFHSNWKDPDEVVWASDKDASQSCNCRRPPGQIMNTMKGLHVTWEHLGIPQVKLMDVAEKRHFCATPCCCCCKQSPDQFATLNIVGDNSQTCLNLSFSKRSFYPSFMHFICREGPLWLALKCPSNRNRAAS